MIIPILLGAVAGLSVALAMLFWIHFKSEKTAHALSRRLLAELAAQDVVFYGVSDLRSPKFNNEGKKGYGAN